MKRRTSLTEKLLNKDVFRQMIKDGQLNGIKDIEDILKDMFGDILQQFLEAEMDEALGYSKYCQRQPKIRENTKLICEKTPVKNRRFHHFKPFIIFAPTRRVCLKFCVSVES